jgi:hypothetical protein
MQARPSRLRAMAALVALTSLFVVFPQPQASAGLSACRRGELCVWEDKGYRGCFARLPMEDKNYADGYPAWENCPGVTMNDKISSYANRRDRWAGFWTYKDRQDLALCVTPDGESPDLDNLANPESYEDEISSHYTFLEGRGERPAFAAYDDGYCYVYDED